MISEKVSYRSSLVPLFMQEQEDPVLAVWATTALYLESRGCVA